MRIAAYWAVGGMSAVALFLFGADKLRAKRGCWRIRERTLLLCAALGAPGAFLGMLLFRHKTRKPLFRILVPLFLLLDAGILIAVRP